MEASSYTIGRKSAAKFLKVTLRSIDRYLRSGKLSARNRNGHIWLSKKELSEFQQEKLMEKEILPEIRAQKHPDDAFYRDLYEETRRLLDYRISHLESAHFHKNDPEKGSLSTEEVRELKRENEALMKKLHKEKINRHIVSAILYILLALQPVLWYFLKFMESP